MAIILCGEILWLLLIGVVHSRDASDREIFAALAGLVLLIAFRCGISFVLVLAPERVISRTFARTRQWRYCELRSAQTIARPSGSTSRKIILLTPRIGPSHKLTILEDDPEVPSAFDTAVAEINTRIFGALMQAAMGPS